MTNGELAIEAVNGMSEEQMTQITADFHAALREAVRKTGKAGVRQRIAMGIN